MMTVKVLYDNGDSVVTSINGTRSDIQAYYIGQTFNIGAGDQDLLAVGVDVVFYDDENEVQ